MHVPYANYQVKRLLPTCLQLLQKLKKQGQLWRASRDAVITSFQLQ